MQKNRLHAAAPWLVIVVACLMGVTHAQENIGSSPATHSSQTSDAPQVKDPLAGWTPSPRQTAALAVIPSDVEAQRQELLRIARIPLPSYEERLMLEYLTGSIFPEKHPLRRNEEYLLDYYKSLGKVCTTPAVA